METNLDVIMQDIAKIKQYIHMMRCLVFQEKLNIFLDHSSPSNSPSPSFEYVILVSDD
jgi:hypothetical protein